MELQDFEALEIYYKWRDEMGLWLTTEFLLQDELIALIKQAYKEGYIEAMKKNDSSQSKEFQG